jgi:hypothetical protein
LRQAKANRKERKMIRNLKALGIAFAAMFVMSAVAASAAHATAAHFRVGDGAGTATVTVEQDPSAVAQVFHTSAGNITCLEFHATGSANATTPTITLENIEYKNCEFESTELAASVNFGTCHYEIAAGNTETSPENSTGTVVLKPAGCQIHITSLTCNVTVEGEQEFVNQITFSNTHTTGKNEEITAHATASGIVYTTSAGCPGGGGNHNDGTYTGKVTARATAHSGGSGLDLTLVDT